MKSLIFYYSYTFYNFVLMLCYIITHRQGVGFLCNLEEPGTSQLFTVPFIGIFVHLIKYFVYRVATHNVLL